MDEETGAAPAKEDEATSASDGASCTTSAQTEIMKNSYIRNESDTTDAAKTVDLSTAEASTEEFSKKYSTEAASTVATPEPLHVLGQQAPSSPTSTASPSANSAAAEEVERLRREAEQIKAEQLKLEEEIRLAKLKKEELTKEVKFINTEEEEEDHIDIYCENPIDVMSAITEDHRTLMLKQDDHLEVMSQITEARTEARYFSDLQRRNKWMIGFAVILIVIVIAGVVGGVVSSNGNYGEDNPSGVEGEIGALNPTSSPIKSGPAIIDITDDDRPISEFPTLSPSYSVGTTASPSFNTIYASRVKIQSNNEAILNVFEVEIFDPAGVNVALGRNATQSSTFENFNASNAVDGVADTFSSTLKEVGAWWEVNLGGQLIPIQNMTIINYWCFDVSDQANCLARLSDSTLLLLDNDGTVLATRDIGDTTGIFELDFSFDTTIEASFPPVDSSPEVHNKIPTNMPSVGPIQTPAAPIPAPSSAPTADLSCPTGEGIFTVFFQFGADPSQISWAVVEECTNESIVVCDNCYQEYSPYSSADSHNCLSLDKTYTFIFEDAADDLWPSDSGFTISLNGDMDSKVGNGGSMPDTTIYFGDGLACPASSPTAKPTMGPTTPDQLPFPYDYPFSRFVLWDDLDNSTRTTAQSLGYTSSFWNTPNTFELEYNYQYNAFNSSQKQAINDLGMDQNQWDCFMHHYENVQWDYMPDHAREALIDLGWVRCSWEKEEDCLVAVPDTEYMNWRQLVANERAAAINLCWFRSSWDGYTLPW